MSDIVEELRRNNEAENYDANVKLIDELDSEQVKHSLAFYNEAAVSYWRCSEDRKADGAKLYQQMMARIINDEDLYEEISNSEGFELTKYNMRHYQDHLSARSDEGMTIGIVCYYDDRQNGWDPRSIKEGIMGSEEAVIYASQALAKMGHQVTVYAMPPNHSPWSLPLANPKFVRETEIKTLVDKLDMIVLWRRTDFSVYKNYGKTVMFWPHDIATQKFNVSGLSGCFFLSEYHRNDYIRVVPEIEKIPYVICGNGIQLEQFPKPKSYTNPYSCIYASNYSRGLNVLLHFWPEIRNKYPKATLDIYYGRQTWGTISEQNLNNMIQKIETLKVYGVTEHGKVGHQKLADAMQKTSILAYPCTTQSETFCITAVKAQAAGMIPVTTRIGALNETVHSDAPCVKILTNENIGEYRDLLMSVMSRVESEESKASRDQYIQYASKYTWDNCVSNWILLNDIVSA